jgi:hypothetical protein
VFPPYPPRSWPHSEHASVLDWRATVDWLRGKIDPPALTLRLVMADFWYLDDGPNARARMRLSKQDGMGIIHAYVRILTLSSP